MCVARDDDAAALLLLLHVTSAVGRCISVFELLLGKLRAAAAGDATTRKKVPLLLPAFDAMCIAH
jgi:hypothetical protein